VFNLIAIIKGMLLFTGSYGANVFLPPLSKEEEEILVNKMLDGNKDARSKLILHNLRLVAHIVKKFDNKGLVNDDLISIGTIGLIKGIDTYKKNPSTKISTYAAKCIQNELLMHYRQTKKNKSTISLNDSVGYDKEGNEISLGELIVDKRLDVIDTIHNKNNIDLLIKYLNVLTDREREIIIKRYGLNNKKDMTQKEIAKELNISRSYVSRIEKRALTKILREFKKSGNNL
jgi:RNA polymerase sporulation-specific sigma factor